MQDERASLAVAKGLVTTGVVAPLVCVKCMQVATETHAICDRDALVPTTRRMFVYIRIYISYMVNLASRLFLAEVNHDSQDGLRLVPFCSTEAQAIILSLCVTI